MLNLQTAPVLLQVFGNESAMTIVWLVFAAQQAAITYDFFWYNFLNLSITHQIDEVAFVGIPVNSCLSVVTQQIFGRRQVWKVNIIHSTEFASKPGEIIFFCETSKL